ncbi:hypothetical protein ABW19_dt0201041 [Dactylella cylindrospora]|nr:hypothetical protein ABW19_dt0201041 [Dactylella cylindrospora]
MGWTEGIVSSADPFFPELEYNVDLFTTNQVYLVINTTSTEENFPEAGNFTLEGTTQDGSEWTVAKISATETVFSLSLCYSNFAVQDTNITAWRNHSSYTEPKLDWNRDTQTFSTERVRHQLGSQLDPPNALDRGIFQLEIPTSGWGDRYIVDVAADESRAREDYPTIPHFFEGYMPDIHPTGPSSNLSRLMCGRCWVSSGEDESAPLELVNVAISKIFNDILRDTSRPAIAIQSLMTIRYGVAYYDNLPRFDAVGQALIRTSKEVLRPVSRKFLWAVTTVLSLHVLLVFGITLAFMKFSKMSLLGSAWSAVGQMLGDDTIEWAKKGSAMRDSEIEKRMDWSGVSEGAVGLTEKDGDTFVTRRQVSVAVQSRFGNRSSSNINAIYF